MPSIRGLNGPTGLAYRMLAGSSLLESRGTCVRDPEPGGLVRSRLQSFFALPVPIMEPGATAAPGVQPQAPLGVVIDGSQPFDAKGGFASIGHELDETAPVWRVYRDEVKNHDQNVTLDEWNKTLDVLLIFAGLFSAVVTTFVVSTYPLLNPQDDSATRAIYVLAHSINNGVEVPAPQAAPTVKLSSLVVNGLWFTSLFVALAVAFFAILAKQWLVEYNHRMADPPASVIAMGGSASQYHSPTASLSWARRRRFLFEGFDKWHTPVLITQILPFLLHIALFLFLVGLAVLVWTLDRRIGGGLFVLTGVMFALYLVSTALPMWWTDCPTTTPLVRQLRAFPLWLASMMAKFCDTVGRLPLLPLAHVPRFSRLRMALQARMNQLRYAEWREYGHSTRDDAKYDCLKWLILTSGSETAISFAFHSLGTLDPDIDADFITGLRMVTTGMSALHTLQAAPTAIEVIRAVRSELVLGRGSWGPMLGLDITPAMIRTLEQAYYIDAKLLLAAMHAPQEIMTPISPTNSYAVPTYIAHLRRMTHETGSRATSHTLSSTARLLLRCDGMPLRALPYILLALSPGNLRFQDYIRIQHIRDHTLQPNFERGCVLRGLPNHGSECNSVCIASFVCRILTVGDEEDRQMCSQLVFQLLPDHAERSGLRFCPGFLDLMTVPHLHTRTHTCHNLRAVLLPAEACNSADLQTVVLAYDGYRKSMYLGALILTLLSIGESPRFVLPLFDQPTGENLYFLNMLLARERQPLDDHFVLAPELWAKFLVCISAAPITPINSFQLTQILSGASMLKRRGHFDAAMMVIIDAQIENFLRFIGEREFTTSEHFLHFLQHLAELDRGWHSRIGFIVNTQLIRVWLSRTGPCTTCPGRPPIWEPGYFSIPFVPPDTGYSGQPEDRSSAAPEAAGNVLSSSEGFLFTLSPVVQMLLDEEMMRSIDQQFVLAPETWTTLLFEVTNKLATDSLSLATLTPLLAAVCMLKRRQHVNLSGLVDLLLSRVRDWFSTMNRNGFARTPTHERHHFLRHLAELDPNWHSHLRRLQTPPGSSDEYLDLEIATIRQGLASAFACGECPGPAPTVPLLTLEVAQYTLGYLRSVPPHELEVRLTNLRAVLEPIASRLTQRLQADPLAIPAEKPLLEAIQNLIMNCLRLKDMDEGATSSGVLPAETGFMVEKTGILEVEETGTGDDDGEVHEGDGMTVGILEQSQPTDAFEWFDSLRSGD